MNLQLRVLHGSLKRQNGADLGSNISVRGKRFVIGSGPECHMRCPSSQISEYHCEIFSEDGSLFIRDLSSETGTFVNGERISGKRPVAHGDRLQIGKLEFEAVVTEPKPAAPAKPKVDPVGENISEMLAEADAEERLQRQHDPATRIFKPTAPAPAEDQAADKSTEKKKLERPPRKPPGKLPPPPKIVADNTVNAAEEVLKKFFEKPKR